jgi:hypothetical protein
MRRTQADRESRSEAGSGRARRARARILLAAALVLLLLLLASPFVLVRFASVRDPLLRLAQARAGLGGDVRLRVDGVDRFDPLGIELRGVGLEWRGPDARWERVSRIGSLSADWKLAPLATGRIQVGAVRIDTLEVSLPALNAYLLRPGLPEKRAPSALQRGWAQLVPPVTVGAVVVTHARIIDRDGVMVLGGLRLTDLSSSNRGLAGMLERGDVVLPRQGLSIALRDGRLTADADGAARIEALTLESGESRLRVDAGFDPRVAAFPLRVRIELERLRVSDLDRWIPPALPHRPGDSLAGTIELRRGPPGVRGEILLHGRLAGESLRALRVAGDAGSDTVRVSELALEADAVSLIGHGAYLRAHRAGTASLAWHDLDPRSAWLPEEPAVPLAPGVSGEVELSFVLPTAGPPTFDGSAIVEGLAWDRGRAERVRISGQLVPGRFVRAESLAVELKAGRIEASGLWPLDGGSVDVAARFEALDLAVVPEIARAGAWGTASGEVHLQGPVRGLTIEGALSATPLGWREWRSDTLRADSVWLRLRSLEGGATLHLAGLWRNDRAMARELFVRATRSGVPIAVEARLTGPNLEFDLAGNADPRGSAELRRAHLWERRLGDVDLDAPWHLRWSADSVAADTLRLVSPLGHVDLAGRWSRRDGAVDGELRTSRIALGDMSRWLGGADTLRGACAMRVIVGGRLPDPTIELDLACDRVEWGPLDLGVPHVLAAWRDSTLRVGSVTIEGSAARMRVPEFRISADRPLLALLRPDRDRGRVSLADLPCAGRIEITRLAIAELTGLAEVLNLPVAGTVTGTGSQLLVGGESVPLRVIPVGEAPVGKVERSLRGLLRATLELSGTPRAPRVRLEGGLDQLRAAGSDVGDIRFAAEYADSVVTVRQLDLVHEGRTSWARGRYPMQLTLIPPALHLTDREADLQAELNDLNLALVSGFTRYVPDASGRLSGTLSLSGPGNRPRLEGKLQLHEGGFRIPSRSERIRGAEGQFTLGPDGLTIRSLDARTGTHGTVSVTGTLRSRDSFELNAHAENVRAFEAGRYDGVADGDLNAYTMPDAEGGRPIPHLDGVVDVREFTLTQDLARKELITPGAVIPWQIDLDVRAPGNVHLSQLNGSAELGEGQLHIAYRWPYWNLSGSIRLLSGTYRLLNNAFTVTDGTVEFRDAGAGPDLTVSADAETYVAVATEGNAPQEEITVTVHVEGKPEALEVSLSSQPPMNQEAIVELLSVGRLTRTGVFEPGAQTQWILLNTMVDRIENNLLQQSRIFNRLTLEPGTTGEEPLKMTLRPIVTPAFMVNYSQDLSVDPARELSVNYRLSRVLYLRAGIARDRQAVGGFNDEYSLDLKCRFEYR